MTSKRTTWVFIGIALGIIGTELIYQGELIDDISVVNSKVEVEGIILLDKIETKKLKESEEAGKVAGKSTQEIERGSHRLIFGMLGIGAVGHGIYLYSLDHSEH